MQRHLIDRTLIVRVVRQRWHKTYGTLEDVKE